MSLALVTPPALEPLTVREVQAHLRLDLANVEPVPGAPSVALAGGGGNVDNGAHRYRVTFVTADGETDGGTISAAATVVDKTASGQVSVTNIPLGGSAVIARNLYRTAAAGAAFFLLATIVDNTTTAYVDNVADAALGVGAPTINTTGDPGLFDLLRAARQHLEKKFGRAFLTQTWRLTLDGFPFYSPAQSSFGGDEIDLPMPLLQSVTSVEYVDNDGATQTLAPTAYVVDTDHFPGRIVRAYNTWWPVTRWQPNAVTITYVAGFSAPALVPYTWKAALKLLIGHWNENREQVVLANMNAIALPNGVDDLMWPDRYLEIA